MKVGVAVGFQVEGVVVVDVVVVVVVVSVVTLIVGMLVGLAVTIDAVGFGVTACTGGFSLLSISLIETSTLASTNRLGSAVITSLGLGLSS